MRKMFWSLVLLSGYIWIVTTGNEQWIFDQGKRLYGFVRAWFSDAEIDFQVDHHPAESKKKKPRRWD